MEDPYNEEGSGTNVILSYFKKMYSESHPEKIEIVPSEFKIFLDEIISKFGKRKILFVDANQCNQRIVMQQGLFLFPYTLESDELLEIVKDNTSTIKIHKDLRSELLDYLDTIGLNTFRLMPDLQSVCHAVKRKVTEERQAASTLFKKKSSISAQQNRSNIEKIHNLLKEGFGRYKRDDGYANIASIGSFIKRKDPDFDVHAYGFSKLSDLVMSFPNKYETKKDYTHRVPHYSISLSRLRKKQVLLNIDFNRPLAFGFSVGQSPPSENSPLLLSAPNLRRKSAAPLWDPIL